MNIILNGEPREIADRATISQLLGDLQLRSEQVAVEVNFELVPRARHAEFVLNSDDQLELVTLAGGG